MVNDKSRLTNWVFCDSLYPTSCSLSCLLIIKRKFIISCIFLAIINFFRFVQSICNLGGGGGGGGQGLFYGTYDGFSKIMPFTTTHPSTLKKVPR